MAFGACKCILQLPVNLSALMSIKELSKYIHHVRVLETQCGISGCLQIIIHIQENFT